MGRSIGEFLGLTPSQHSSGEWITMGDITRCGSYEVRTRLMESSGRKAKVPYRLSDGGQLATGRDKNREAR